MPHKSKIQRMREVKNLMEQLQQLGLGPHVDSVRDFQEIANTFVQTGRGAYGIIPLPSQTDRVLVYELTDKTNVACNIILKYQGTA